MAVSSEYSEMVITQDFDSCIIGSNPITPAKIKGGYYKYQMAKENKFQKLCIDTIIEQGGYVVNILGSPLIPKGTHDLIACVNGRFLSCEIKRPDGKGEISPHQIIQGKKVLKSRGGVIYCENINHLIEVCKYFNSLPIENFPTNLIFGGLRD